MGKFYFALADELKGESIMFTHNINFEAHILSSFHTIQPIEQR
jgi:hypothetical protein